MDTFCPERQEELADKLQSKCPLDGHSIPLANAPKYAVHPSHGGSTPTFSSHGLNEDESFESFGQTFADEASLFDMPTLGFELKDRTFKEGSEGMTPDLEEQHHMLLAEQHNEEVANYNDQQHQQEAGSMHSASIRGAEGILEAEAERQLSVGVKVVPRLYVGGRLAATNHQWLSDNELRYIVNVTAEMPSDRWAQESDATVRYKQIPVEDTPEARFGELLFEEGARFIHEALRKDQHSGVFVHSSRGITRAPTLVMAYLIKFMHWPLRAAYERLSLVLPDLRLTTAFKAQLMDYELLIHKHNSIDFHSHTRDKIRVLEHQQSEQEETWSTRKRRVKPPSRYSPLSSPLKGQSVKPHAKRPPKRYKSPNLSVTTANSLDTNAFNSAIEANTPVSEHKVLGSQSAAAKVTPFSTPSIKKSSARVRLEDITNTAHNHASPPIGPTQRAIFSSIQNLSSATATTSLCIQTKYGSENCHIQIDQATDGQPIDSAVPLSLNSSHSPTLNLPAPTSKRRGHYKCGRCGQPKKGHHCTAPKHHHDTSSSLNPHTSTPTPSPGPTPSPVPTPTRSPLPIVGQPQIQVAHNQSTCSTAPDIGPPSRTSVSPLRVSLPLQPCVDTQRLLSKLAQLEQQVSDLLAQNQILKSNLTQLQKQRSLASTMPLDQVHLGTPAGVSIDVVDSDTGRPATPIDQQISLTDTHTPSTVDPPASASVAQPPPPSQRWGKVSEQPSVLYRHCHGSISPLDYGPYMTVFPVKGGIHTHPQTYRTLTPEASHHSNDTASSPITPSCSKLQQPQSCTDSCEPSSHHIVITAPGFYSSRSKEGPTTEQQQQPPHDHHHHQQHNCQTLGSASPVQLTTDEPMPFEELLFSLMDK